MKRVYVNEKWCLACHLCEYYCAFANSGLNDMVKLKGKEIHPRIRVEEAGEGSEKISFAVNCRQCADPICVKVCIAGALRKEENGVIVLDQEKCVGCQSCVMACPVGGLSPSDDGLVMQKCQLCLQNSVGEPNCVKNCPNRAIVYEE
jgi:carbon-monoxide dehydrogenase iron sulfur subunit